MSFTQTSDLNVDKVVRERYSSAAKAPEASLCCPTAYDPRLIEVIPAEVLDRDYGCGNPTPYLRTGDTVLDLGSGSGKVCFIASQIVGPEGRVIGVDANDDMLALARRSSPIVAERIGFANVDFRKGRIQDLSLDLEKLDRRLSAQPVRSAEDLALLDAEIANMREMDPLIADGSVDVVISNCVLNLVRPDEKSKLFGEIHRVLRTGGRAVISDIVSDEEVPEHLRLDPELWSGCISGALREDLFLRAFEEADLYGVTLLERQDEPWRTVEGIEFRSVTVVAYKGKEGPCIDQKHAVLYRGPFREVTDDDGHVLRRGVRAAVCEKTFRLYSQEPYRSHLELIRPRVLVPLQEAPPFPCSEGTMIRDPRETKGQDYRITTEATTATCGGEGGGAGSRRCC